MKHKGEIFEKAVRRSKISIVKIAQNLGYTGRHMYNLFEDKDLPDDVIIKTGKFIGYDFTEDFPELMIINEPEEEYQTQANYKEKYLRLLEKYVLNAEEYKLKIAEYERLLAESSAPSEPGAPKVRQIKKGK